MYARSGKAPKDGGYQDEQHICSRIAAHLEQTYHLNEGQIQQLLTTSAASLASLLGRAEQALAERNAETLREAAH
jgi:hypothetical protein